MNRCDFRNLEAIKNLVGNFFARRMPKRLLMWACLNALADYSYENSKEAACDIKAMDVIKAMT